MSKKKYITEFSDIMKNRYKIEILDDEFEGKPLIMELGGEAVTLSRPTKKINEPLFSMGITIQALCNTNFEYQNLFATREQTNQVVLYRGKDVIFRGWIEPDLYEEEFVSPPYYITIPASDGLTALENYYPPELKGTGLISLLSVIKACLDCTGLRLPINIACSINPDDKTDNRLFEHSFVEKEGLRKYKDGVYEYDNARQLLEDVLIPFSCRCYQSGDEWYIERIKDRVSPSVKWVRYATDGTVTVLTKTDSIELDTPDYKFVNSAATLQVDSGYGKQTVKVDGSKWETVIANNFSERINYYIGMTDFKPFIADYRVWSRCGYSINTAPYTSAEIQQGVRIEHMANSSYKDRVWQRTRITANYEDEINISFKLTVEPGNKEAYSGNYKVRLQSYIRESKNKYESILLWNKDNPDEARYLMGMGDYISKGVFNTGNDWKEGFSKPIDISITGKLRGFSSSLYMDELVFVILPVEAQTGKESWSSSSDYVKATIVGDVKVSVNEKQKYDNTFTATINRKYMREADDIDVRFWTLPDKDPASKASNYNYKNGLVNADYSGIRSICCPEEKNGALTIPERLLIDNFDQYYDPRDTLSGEVMTDHFISPEQHVGVATRPDKSFLLVGLDASLRDAVFETNIEEIKPHQITIK